MTTKTQKFSAEIGRILEFMINSIYTNKDIFLRELISNASDACDKLRFEALQNHDLTSEELAITVELNESDRTISVTDNGIGMTEEEMNENLGVIAQSGTQKFMDSVKGGSFDVSQIGQFGVGFYSAFMVADNVTVYSTKVGTDVTNVWQSDGKGEYTISDCTDEEYKLTRGTKVVLHIKDSEAEYLQRYKLHNIIKTYSDLISFKITLFDGKDSEVVNSAVALWSKNKSDITEEQYNEFYHYIAHAFDTPWARLHYKAEGAVVEYTCLLYIPSQRPFDLFNPDRTSRVKLYIKKVFINEGNDGLIPPYFRFLRGVIESDDLPLNISREVLQHNQGARKIRQSIVRKVLGMLKQRAADNIEDYKEFWGNFGEVLKEGLCEPAFEEKEQLLEVCRFATTHESNFASLDDYISRMIDGQNQIFYLNDEPGKVANNPQLEGYKKRGIEVLLLSDQVDDFWINVINQYKNYELCSVGQAGIDLDAIKTLEREDSSDATLSPETEDNLEALLEYIKDKLGGKIKDVKTTTKLVDSPACLAVSEGGLNIRMEKFLVAQKQKAANSAKILEINLSHPLVKKIRADVTSGNVTEKTDKLVSIIFNQACIVAGEDMPDPYAFTKELNDILLDAL